MAFRLALLLLLLAVASVARSSAGEFTRVELVPQLVNEDGPGDLRASGTCNGLVGECIGEDEEMEMESEISRRALYGMYRHVRYISYAALARNRVPCTRRGHSYYNCQRRGRANPYRRGCSVITQCARSLG